MTDFTGNDARGNSDAQACATDFRDAQRAFAAHLRDPANNPAPPGLEDRRLAIYRELFFNSIESLLAGNFPVLKRILEPDDQWRALVRHFYAHHRSRTPYFTQIANEFVAWLGTLPPGRAPDFAQELAHYEWVELALSIEETELPLDAVDGQGDLLEGVPALSPLAWSLAYAWPVHRLAPEQIPPAPGEHATRLVVYRNRADRIGFLEINAVTARLLERLEPPGAGRGRDVLTAIAGELGMADPAATITGGAQILAQLREHDIVLGTWRDTR
ncbi:MAG: putative DNA-binding domain-containing protein [Gammaproteobacteria bacterium]|nr:putative DNA-binding domain-containing protein [Gammaproteobacteria bacterium]